MGTPSYGPLANDARTNGSNAVISLRRDRDKSLHNFYESFLERIARFGKNAMSSDTCSVLVSLRFKMSLPF
jgi:hypothetical protein